MPTGPEVTDATSAESDGRKRLDLSVPQVAGSAVAAVVAAKLASNVGVYGTIIGAGLVSIVATCGGSVFQHFFARTGERVRDAAVQSMPKGRQVPLPGDPEGVPGDPDPTRVIDARDPARAQVPDPARTQLLAAVDPEATARFGTAGPGHPPGRDTPTRLLGTVRPSHLDGDHPDGGRADRGGGPYGPHDGDGVGGDEYGEYGESTVHRARTRRWKRPLIAAAVVFGVTMGGITTYELVSGETFSGGGKGTTIGEAVTGDSGRGARPDAPAPEAPAEVPSGSPGQDGTDGTDGTDGGEDTDRDGDGGSGPTAPTPEDDPGTDGRQSERPSDGPGTEPAPSTGQDGGPGTATPPGTGTGSTPPPAPTPSPSTGGPTQSVPEQRQGTTPSP
ncbi:hypothetical protein ACIP88_31385 [Streptomyces uncialis]|uniref:hypothetical protein n=1 Tax=Streptomyces uncialis TaxID=1048205 RepID=UPI00380FF692